MSSAATGSNDSPIGEGKPRASLVRRLASFGYETLLFAAIAVAVGFVTLPLTPPRVEAAGVLRVPALPVRIASFLLIFGAGALYFGWSWSGGRCTLAMRTWRIGLERRDGGALDRRRVLLRYAAAWIGPVLALAAYAWLRRLGHGAYAAALLALNFAWAFVDPDRQFLHDRIAGTRLVASGAAPDRSKPIRRV